MGRPTKWGNPYSHLPGKGTIEVKNRDEAVAAYTNYLMDNPKLLQAVRKELRGKDLVCWCAPLTCHADVLLEFANAEV